MTHGKLCLARPLAAAAAVIGLAATASQAQFSFSESVEYGPLLGPSGMTSGDFDGDDDIDLATTAGGLEDGIVVLPNAGDGTFGTAITSLLPAPWSPQDLIAGDLDGDDDVDIAVAGRDDPDGVVIVMLNNGAGSFTEGTTVFVGERPRGMSIADLDNDQDQDLVVANRLSDTVSILINNGSGVFTVQTVAVGAEPRDTACGNFMGDARLEIVVSNHDDRTVSVLAESGGSYLATMTMVVGDPIRPDGVVAANLDGVGFDDFAVATSHFAGPGDNADFATVYLNNGAGFDGPFNYDTGGTTSSELIAADLDCDGSVDLVVSNTDSNDVSLMPNNGDGTFGDGQRAQTGSGPSKSTAADLDGDNDPDLAVANSLSDDVSVLINLTCTVSACPWDLDGDGDVGINDFLIVLGNWGLPGGDVDGDGTTGITDFLALLGHWGPC